MYVGSKCESVVTFKDKTDDLAMIVSLRLEGKSKRPILDNKNFQDRRNICKWANITTFKSKHSMSICGIGIQCPALSNALLVFNFHVDSISANQLFDAILSDTVPVLTLLGQFQYHQQFIDW